jgi:predicted RNA-binding protein with TRAM domain
MPRFERRGGFRRSYGPRMDDIPKPVKVGEEYDVEISEVGTRGDGIARVKNFVVFVNGAKQGEKIRIKIKEVRDRFATGEKADAAEAVEGGKAVEKEASESETEEATEETTEEVAEETTEEAGETGE